MKHLFYTLTLAAFAAFSLQAEDYMTSYICVSNVTLRQFSRTQDVEVKYSLANGGEPACVMLDIRTNGVSIGIDKIKTVSGDISSAVTNFVSEGDKTIIWKARNDWRGNFSTNAEAHVLAYRTNLIGNLYMVIDLSEGPNATRYPVSYSVFDPNPLTDTSCASNHLWLKWIPAGSFMMGVPDNELSFEASQFRTYHNPQHKVTLTSNYYAGVFPVTQMQYYLVTGVNFTDNPLLPVLHSWEECRGSNNWPTVRTVSPTSFMGILRSKTGLKFDLPTAAQFEYARRAGTTTAWNNGMTITNNTIDAELSKLGWYKGNSGGVLHPVGRLQPNAWGLYDMHGNKWTWCLDWWQDSLGTDAVIDPVGPNAGSERVIYGADFGDPAQFFMAGFRWKITPISKYSFRVFLTLP